MCGSKSNLSSSKTLTEAEFMKMKSENATCLLEFAACDDLKSFKKEIEEKSLQIDELGFWYCKRVGSKEMGFEERTPLMIASMYGSISILNYIIATGNSDVNRVSGKDKVTALHCAVSGSSVSIVEVITILLNASASPNCVDGNGNKPVDLVTRFSRFMSNQSRKSIELLLTGNPGLVSIEEEEEVKLVTTKYPADISLPDINEGLYGTDDFRMFSFKVKPCSRAYSHDWTECPFVHPGENARRRDPRKYPYTCVPCPEFRKGSCPKGDSCEYAHGVFESWLHPAQYRTRLCKDETGCARRVCFFAHRKDELRPVNVSTGSAMVSPRSSQCTPEMLAMTSSPMNSPLSPRNGVLWQNRVSSLTPPPLQLNGSRLKSSLSARDMDMELRFHGLDNRRLSDFEMNLYPSSPARQQPLPPGFESSRSSAFSTRSLSFKPASATADWGSPNGKLDWGMQREELNKLRRSASNVGRPVRDYSDEPDVSWVNSLVKESPQERTFGMNERVQVPSWVEQMYIDHEKQQIVA